MNCKYCNGKMVEYADCLELTRKNRLRFRDSMKSRSQLPIPNSQEQTKGEREE